MIKNTVSLKNDVVMVIYLYIEVSILTLREAHGHVFEISTEIKF